MDLGNWLGWSFHGCDLISIYYTEDMVCRASTELSSSHIKEHALFVMRLSDLVKDAGLRCSNSVTEVERSFI